MDGFRRQLEFNLGVPFSDGNSVEILTNGNEVFPAMLEAIESATRRVDLLTYVYWSGDIARQFAEALSAKAREGVAVRVVLDSFGCAKMPDQLSEMMQSSGVELRWFRPLSNWKIWSNDKRTHRKVLVTDDQIGFTGGIGIADEWDGNAEDQYHWRDTHFRLQGPAVHGLKSAFLDNWNEAGDWCWDADHGDPVRTCGHMPVQIVRASSTIEWTETASLLRLLVAMARDNLMITTPYFVPDAALIEHLRAASARGVATTILMPGPYIDMRLPQLAGESSIEALLQAGIKIYRYQKTFIHAKVIIVDGLASCVGSANLNHRSMGKDEECCAVVLSEQFAADLARQFEEDCAESELLELEAWRNRGGWQRAKERFARLALGEL